VAELPSSLTDVLRDCYVLRCELGRGGVATVYLARVPKVANGREEADVRVVAPCLRAEVVAGAALSYWSTTLSDALATGAGAAGRVAGDVTSWSHPAMPSVVPVATRRQRP